MHGIHHPDRKRRFQHCDSHVSECDGTWNTPDTKPLCHWSQPLSFAIHWRLIKGLETTHTLRCWQPRCAFRIRNNKGAVLRHTTFIIANPIAATCFGCIIRPYVPENVNRKLYRAVRLSFHIYWYVRSDDAAETAATGFVIIKVVCLRSTSLLSRIYTCLACCFQRLGLLNIQLKTGYNA
jgi:hypothetical protein